MEATATSSSDEHVCVICLSPITERAITVPCKHCAFDFICLVSWLQERSTCPLCASFSAAFATAAQETQPISVLFAYSLLGKAEVTAVQYDWSSPTDFKSYPVRPTHPCREARSRHPRSRLPQRPRAFHRPYEQPQPDLPVLRRRHVYRNKLYSFHIGSNPLSGHQDVTPEMMARSPELQSKARTWIRRELRVFAFLHTDPEGGPSRGATTSSNAEFLLSYIVAILKKVDLKASSGHSEELLREFLGRKNARLFLHELNAWLRSPYSKLWEWDRNVQYAEELPESFDERGLPMARGKTSGVPNALEDTRHEDQKGG